MMAGNLSIEQRNYMLYTVYCIPTFGPPCIRQHQRNTLHYYVLFAIKILQLQHISNLLCHFKGVDINCMYKTYVL